jgi:hypothetical protein
MSSLLDPDPTTLSDQLRQLGLFHIVSDLNDFVARATQKRWSPVVLPHPGRARCPLASSRRRRLRDARLDCFKTMAEFDWN